jgi:dTDP-4-dehydrorhamnose reductase
VRVLLTGRHGQLGWELERSLGGFADVTALDRAQLDLCDPAQIRAAVRTVKPAIIVNAAAYTAVDQAEAQPVIAQRVNGDAPGVMAEEAKRIGALLVHYSTDYVFDGEADRPYTEEDTPNPLNVYGRTKLDGERAIQATGCRHLILRTCWIYGMRGGNFLVSMLRLAAERPEIRVVDDQIGSPTWSRAVADATCAVLMHGARMDSGVYHAAALGYVSWFGFARQILERTAHLRASQPRLLPITSEDYAASARRPRHARLATAKLSQALGQEPMAEWQCDLAACLADHPRWAP